MSNRFDFNVKFLFCLSEFSKNENKKFTLQTQPKMDKTETHNQELFNGKIAVRFRDNIQNRGSENLSEVNLKLSSFAFNGKLLQIFIRLSMESDPLFLYMLEMRENDFLLIKKEQNLLVNFQEFPNTLVEVLNSFGPSSRFLATLVQNNGNLSPNVTFSIVEKIPFKEITYLNLKMPKGDVGSSLAYLSEELKLTKV
eukprot:GHVP01004998.1.p1 GENE.GHVP01004998.1~~GHVP01004998.1.p1  ORF type:complete len:197 (+),score=34.80 GHVP01004998.1:394-984(+)